MVLKYFIFGLLLYLHYQINQCSSVSVAYISTEHPEIIWYDPKYCKNVTLLSKRFNRQDPRYYVRLYLHMLIPLSNAITLDFYFYQFLTNRYRPSFVEMHFKFCDMINVDPFFGETMKKALGGRTCPYPPGEYDMQNLTIPFVPKSFPFVKGRIYCNVSLVLGGVTKLLGNGSIDMEIKLTKIKNKTKK